MELELNSEHEAEEDLNTVEKEEGGDDVDGAALDKAASDLEYDGNDCR